MSVAMCRTAAADGITHGSLRLTPTIAIITIALYLQSLVDHLQSLIGPSLTLSLGCDFHLSYENLQDVVANPARYAIQGSHYMLVKLSNYGVRSTSMTASRNLATAASPPSSRILSGILFCVKI